MLYGWEGNRRSGVAPAMRHRLSGIFTYGLNGLGKGDEHPPTLHSEYYDIFTFTFNYAYVLRLRSFWYLIMSML